MDVSLYSEYAGRYVKNDYDLEATPETPILDVDLSVMLKLDNKAFKIEKYVHNYPPIAGEQISRYSITRWTRGLSKQLLLKRG